MKTKKPKISGWKIITIILFVLAIGLLIGYFIRRANQPTVITTGQFRTVLVETSKKEDDKHFLANVNANANDGTVSFTEYKSNTATKKIVSLTSEDFNTYFSTTNPTVIAPESPFLADLAASNPKFLPAANPKYNLLVSEATAYPTYKNGVFDKVVYPDNWSVIRPEPGFDWWGLIRSFLPLLIIIGISVFFFKAQMKAMGGGLNGPSSNQAIKIKSKIKFSDVAGNAEVKEEVMELVDYLRYPQKYSAAGARIPKGILLGGPPGTGKTLLAKATAGEASVPFFFISASNFVEMYVGLGAKRVRDMFKEARKESPAIIFIDELDAIGRRRGSGVGGGNDEREQTLNQILVEMDGIVENSGILIIAATNRVDILDPALLRPGRFDRTITVNLPDIKEREDILRLHARGKRLSPDILFENIAKRTPGYSGAQLENVINEAAILSVREKNSVITSAQIDEAIDRVMSGPAKKGRVISAEELKMVAHHEAGHAVVGLKVPGGNKVHKITIIPRGNAGGYNLMLPETEKYNMTKKEMLAMIASYMGGRAAEELIYGAENISTGAGDDIARATKIARKMVTEYGMSNLGPIKYEEDTENPFLGRDYAKSSSFSSKVANEIDIAVREIILEAQEIALKTIAENRELHELITQALLENETIVKEEIDYIAENLKLPIRKKTEEVKVKEYSIDELIAQVSTKEKAQEEIKQDSVTQEAQIVESVPSDSVSSTTNDETKNESKPKTTAKKVAPKKVTRTKKTAKKATSEDKKQSKSR